MDYRFCIAIAIFVCSCGKTAVAPDSETIKRKFVGAANLSWMANSEPDLSGYKVYYGSDGSGNYSRVEDVGNVTLFHVRNLMNELKYFFVLTAYDSSGNESGFSNEVSLVTSDGSTPAKIWDISF